MKYVAVILLLALPAMANSVSFGGSSYLTADASLMWMSDSRGFFSFYTYTPACICLGGRLGVPLTINLTAFTDAYGGLLEQGFRVGAVEFTSTLVTVSGDALTVPVTFTAFLQAYNPVGVLLATLTGSGTGTAQIGYDYNDLNFNVNSAYIDFSGRGNVTTPAPEPSSLLLLGTGLAGLAGAIRRKCLKSGRFF